MQATTTCIGCGAAMPPAWGGSGRYPERLCKACVARAVDERGRALAFYNEDMNGGFIAVVVETNERSAEHACFVDDKKYWADEAYGGGIVLVPYARRAGTR